MNLLSSREALHSKNFATRKKVRINGKKYMTHKIRQFREIRAARDPRNEKTSSAFVTRPWQWTQGIDVCQERKKMSLENIEISLRRVMQVNVLILTRIRKMISPTSKELGS